MHNNDVHEEDDEDDEGLAKSGYGTDSSISARRIVTSCIYVYHHTPRDHDEES